MNANEKATQAAMAAEIGARLGRMNRSKAWLHREAGISASAWRHYFTAFDRDVPLSVVRSIAAQIGTSAGVLITLAEEHAADYAGDFLKMNADERREWDRMMGDDRSSPMEGGEGQEDLTGS